MLEDARITLDSRQRKIVIVFLILLVACSIYYGKMFFVVVNLLVSIFYLVTILYKFFLVLIGFVQKQEIVISSSEIKKLPEYDLPVYTILLPVYKETGVLKQLITAITQIDYPGDKLDVKLLVEETDTAMHQALKKIKLPEFFEVVIVPDSFPRTKPKACNIGLSKAKGEYLVIYDAEDIPDADQLKKSVIAFRKLDNPLIICLQAKLNYYNPRQNLLTRWFTSEYSMWFDLYLPGLDGLNAPIPLGGTSNHFRVDALRKVGGWDPYNVAEDCDLGIRLFRQGYRTRVLDSTTWEEANSRLKNWMRQRSRWVKGYIQTWCVHMRKPIFLLKRMGVINFFSFQLTVAGLFITLLFNPVYWAITVTWLVRTEARLLSGFFYPTADLITWVLLISNGIFVLLNVLGCLRRSYRYLIPETLISPLYWVLISIGAWKGFLQLFTRPHFWEKTEHGLFSLFKASRNL
ncbi:MAG: glycosyltransferase [Candidatus Omnitrophica bacterium]|nr:glycosyltransferase [Candidatus Omnitrophota bacterium]MCM8817168.1 glycosyltransferase [Candidatus Omnitrophota bacterium]